MQLKTNVLTDFSSLSVLVWDSVDCTPGFLTGCSNT